MTEQVAVRKGCLPSEVDKIREAVDIGSVFLALQAPNFITARGVLNWLTTVPVTDARKVAYKAVCMKIPPNEQYLEDGFHFLVKQPDYAPIAIRFNLNPEISLENKPDCSQTVMFAIAGAILKYNNSLNVRKVNALILTGLGDQSYVETNLTLCYRSRTSPHIRYLSADEINAAAAKADWTDKFRYNERLPRLIMKRVIKLQESAPLYYAGIAYKAYHTVAVKLNNNKLLTELTRDELSMFNTYFPDVIDTRILQYDDILYKIALLGNDVAGYVLGFPIQNMIPSDEQIHQALMNLKDLGTEGYIEHIRKYVAQTYNPVLPFPQKEPLTYPNEKDVSFEDIDNYVPFDIVACQIGSHIHRFTRVEAENLLETKKNPWTRESLPITVLSTLKARVDAAKELGLPQARPLSEILTRVNEGTLFDGDEDIPKPEEPPSLPPTLLQSILHLTGTWTPGLQFDESDEMEFNDEGMAVDNIEIMEENSTGLGRPPALLGSVGLEGSEGPEGLTGPQGSVGIQGSLIGPQGSVGLEGSEGPEGFVDLQDDETFETHQTISEIGDEEEVDEDRFPGPGNRLGNGTDPEYNMYSCLDELD